MCNLNCSKSQPKCFLPDYPPALSSASSGQGDLNSAVTKPFTPGHSDEASTALLERVLGRELTEPSSQGFLTCERKYVGSGGESAPIVISPGDESGVCEYGQYQHSAGSVPVPMSSREEPMAFATERDHTGIHIPATLSCSGYYEDSGETVSMAENFGNSFPPESDYSASFDHQSVYPVFPAQQPTLAGFDHCEQPGEFADGGGTYLPMPEFSVACNAPRSCGSTEPSTVVLNTSKSFQFNPANAARRPSAFVLPSEPGSSCQLEWTSPQSGSGQMSFRPVSGDIFTTAVEPSQLATEYYSKAAVSSRFVTSSRVKRTPSAPRMPIKSLDLGFDSIHSEGTLRHHGNDRAVATAPRPPGTKSSMSAATMTHSRQTAATNRLLGLLDLKSFHSQQVQQMPDHCMLRSIGLGHSGTHPPVTNTQPGGRLEFGRIPRPKVCDLICVYI